MRLISCDAAAFDHGWIPPENLLDRYSVRGRGGTVLQPAMHLLQHLVARGEFPAHGPLLVITDGWCEKVLDIPFEHAFLLPETRHLPFRPKGPIFGVQ